MASDGYGFGRGKHSFIKLLPNIIDYKKLLKSIIIQPFGWSLNKYMIPEAIVEIIIQY